MATSAGNTVAIAQEARRRRAALRSLLIASAAAFAGGVAVVLVQLGVGLVSAGYPPAVQALVCTPLEAPPAAPPSLAVEGDVILPLVQFFAGTRVECRIDAPGADYATWSVVGPVAWVLSGPLDTTLPCQTREEFARQDAAHLRLASCLHLRATQPGLFLVSVTVMQRGIHGFDRARLAVRVVPAPEAAPDAGPANARLEATLRIPAATVAVTRNADLSASFREHGLLPESRSFLRTVHQLAPEESFVSATFHARSAANASPVTIAYVPEQRAVTARFTLRSGPFVDRWSGWVSGTVSIELTRQEPAREIALPEASLAVPGTAVLPLPEGVSAEHAEIVLRRPETGTAVTLKPGEKALLDSVRVTARLVDGGLAIEAAR
ncbi:hypothetical protein [Elioraea sp.]|uniref:hypothetical protein n=1 Tax=Elioraea sp. TaxID=2185103 RepID=UPI0025BF3C34|nr:hypothetical protein [Elioraea sp.]